jgi:hypothetical protein
VRPRSATTSSDANLKLDHIIYRLQDDYYRQFYDLYGKHMEG